MIIIQLSQVQYYGFHFKKHAHYLFILKPIVNEVTWWMNAVAPVRNGTYKLLQAALAQPVSEMFHKRSSSFRSSQYLQNMQLRIACNLHLHGGLTSISDIQVTIFCTANIIRLFFIYYKGTGEKDYPVWSLRVINGDYKRCRMGWPPTYVNNVSCLRSKGAADPTRHYADDRTRTQATAWTLSMHCIYEHWTWEEWAREVLQIVEDERLDTVYVEWMKLYWKDAKRGRDAGLPD